MIKIAVNGASGRMGTRICALVVEDPETELVAALERPGHQYQGNDIGTIAGCGATNIRISSSLGTDADVVIDFSSPESAVSIAKICGEKNIALVVGTTGLKVQQLEELQSVSSKIPCFVSPNMSIGVNVMFDLVAQIAKKLGDTVDIEIMETHHRFKKDAPSGTALRLAEKICDATGRNRENNVVYGRQGIIGERPTNQIGIHAIRSGDVIGDHTVVFGSLGEHLEITHKAHTRDTFVRGAIHAAKFLVKKTPGMYSMSDVLQIQT